MKLLNWFKSDNQKKQNNAVNLKQIKQKNILPGEMAAGNLSAAAETVKQMFIPTKILMIHDGDYSSQVTDYALKMAKCLDCEIISLDVSNDPFQFEGERKQREINRFYARAQKSFESFEIQAKTLGIHVTHVIRIGDQEQVIAELSKQDSGIRYVLTKPKQEIFEAEQLDAQPSVNAERRPQIPVFDLNCSRL